MNDTNGIPNHVEDKPDCTRCGGTGEVGLFHEECGECAGTGRDYGLRIKVVAVTFVKPDERRELTHVEKVLLGALR